MMKSLGFVFPGQGSQSVGMLADIATAFPEVQAVFAEASQVLDYDLWELVTQGPAEKLDLTEYTQPALLTGGYAIWRVIQSTRPLKPALLAGHSLGEYTALVCAEALSFPEAVQLVRARGRYMQEAAPLGKGALAAIVGLEDAVVQMICQKAAGDEVLAPANFNSPGQVVIAGDIEAVKRAVQLAKEQGARMAKLLSVSVPSHCILMKPAAEQLKKILANMNIATPAIPVINNVDVAIYDTAESIRDGLVRQLSMPVRWVELVNGFAEKGITHIVECGPGKVLTGLNKRIVPEMQLTQTADVGSLKSLLEMTLQVE